MGDRQPPDRRQLYAARLEGGLSPDQRTAPIDPHALATQTGALKAVADLAVPIHSIFMVRFIRTMWRRSQTKRMYNNIYLQSYHPTNWRTASRSATESIIRLATDDQFPGRSGERTSATPRAISCQRSHGSRPQLERRQAPPGHRCSPRFGVDNGSVRRQFQGHAQFLRCGLWGAGDSPLTSKPTSRPRDFKTLTRRKR